MPIDLGHQVRRNDLGYVFARPAGHWPPVGIPTRGWTACPPEVAALLEVEPGQQVFTRRRAVGPGGRAVQLTTSYYPPDIASGTPVEQADTGPGGVYDRIEQDLGHGPLTWTTQTSARLPTPEEADVLNMSTRLPVLVNTRAAANPTHRVAAVDVVVVDAQLFAVRWDITRDDTASWPNGLALAGVEAVELDLPCDVDHAGLVLAGGEVAGLLGGAGACPVGAVPDEEPRLEDCE
ncbi:MAG: UTRA domain-containing protein [Pseudonocardiaceae bacterium]